jgi:hypothetical protein
MLIREYSTFPNPSHPQIQVKLLCKAKLWFAQTQIFQRPLHFNTNWQQKEGYSSSLRFGVGQREF